MEIWWLLMSLRLQRTARLTREKKKPFKELPNQKSIEMLEGKENHKYLEIFPVDFIKQELNKTK